MMAKDYAFNYLGMPYNHRIPDRKHFTRLRVQSWSSKSLGDAAYSKPSLTPTVEELDLGSTDDLTVLWVGMVPMSAIPEKNTKKGASISSNKNPKAIPFDSEALGAVVAVKNESKMAQTYILVNPTDGLCEGYMVSNQDCFYFKEFRDDEISTVEKRKSEWNNNIRSHINSLALDPNYPFASSQDNFVIRKLVNIDVLFEKQDREAFIAEIEDQWPQLKTLAIQSKEVRHISDGLREANITMEVHLIRAFIVEIISRMRRSPTTSFSAADEAQMCAEALEYVLLSNGP
ncbi:MAG: hypothetical protein Q9199_001855 [Rusavskia elegans]